MQQRRDVGGRHSSAASSHYSTALMALQDLTPQLRTRLSRMERAVGWFVVLAMASLVFGFAYYAYHTAQRKGWFLTKAPYYTFTDSASGIKVGDPVMLMGLAVLMPATVMLLEVATALKATPVWAVKVNALGVLSAASVVTSNAPATPPMVSVAVVSVAGVALDVCRTVTVSA